MGPNGARRPAVELKSKAELAAMRRAGEVAGFLTLDEKLSKHYLDLGGVFMAVGVEAVMLAQQTQALAQRFKSPKG